MYEIVFAGFGGQGILLAGRLLCIAAMQDGKYVSHIPSYGAEMRGGTAHCDVVISDTEIASPVVEHPDTCIVLNTPSLTKFEPRIKPGGTLIYNTSLILESPKRNDIKIIRVDANHIAEANGSSIAANMAVLGRLIAEYESLTSLDSVINALDEAVSERNRKFNPINIAIIKAGYKLK